MTVRRIGKMMNMPVQMMTLRVCYWWKMKPLVRLYVYNNQLCCCLHLQNNKICVATALTLMLTALYVIQQSIIINSDSILFKPKSLTLYASRIFLLKKMLQFLKWPLHVKYAFFGRCVFSSKSTLFYRKKLFLVFSMCTKKVFCVWEVSRNRFFCILKQSDFNTE